MSHHNVEASDTRIGDIVFDGGFSDAMLQCIFDHRSTKFHNLCYMFMRDTPLIKVSFDELTKSQGYLAFHVFNV